MDEERRFALRIARQAGEILEAHFGRLDATHIDLKGAHNPVTEVDRASERFLAGEIRRSYPDDGILAEEETSHELDAARLWVVDPLDGTVNYTHAHPFVAVSVALVAAGRVEVGVVHAPLLGQSFSAVRGGGARRHLRGGTGFEDVPCQVSAVRAPGEALVATGFPYVRDVSPFDNLAPFARLFHQVRGLRRCGAATIDMALVACGVYDAFWEGHLESFDVAAGSLLVEEAGGVVTDYDGKGDYLFGKNIVATNGHLHPFMLENMDRGFDPEARNA